jgi:primase-polymerase (primpol)-like protein
MLDTPTTQPRTAFDADVLARLPIAERAQWVCWRYEVRNGEPTKPPLNARTGRYAKNNDPSTWTEFPRAVARAHHEGWGVGFVFTAGDPYCGVDFDDVIDADGTLAPWVTARVRRLNTYCEVSASGCGVKCIGIATARHNGRHVFRNGSACEVYDRTRYFALSGRAIHSPTVIAACQAELTRIVDHLWPEAPPPPRQAPRTSRLDYSDAEVIRRARAARNGAIFAALWEGRWEHRYGSQSEADLALCRLLSFWCDSNPTRVDALFRRSALYRSKWDRADYRAATLGRACQPMGVA